MAKLYGIGIGSGDPELMTLKAVRIINECNIIIVPNKDIHQSVAYKIVQEAVPEIKMKKVLGFDMPMTKDEDVLRKEHKRIAEQMVEMLKQENDIAFLTLGDPTVFSTFTYIQVLVKEAGYETLLVSGIASFLSAAARINTSLVIRDESLHIIPSTFGIDEGMELKGTKVFMKVGNRLGEIKQKLLESRSEVYFIENCGMENEIIIKGVENIPDKAGYFSMIIVMN